MNPIIDHMIDNGVHTKAGFIFYKHKFINKVETKLQIIICSLLHKLRT